MREMHGEYFGHDIIIAQFAPPPCFRLAGLDTSGVAGHRYFVAAAALNCSGEFDVLNQIFRRQSTPIFLLELHRRMQLLAQLSTLGVYVEAYLLNF